MPPKAKARKPKKPVLQKQKQSQRVVVNINQEKAKRRRASKPRQRQTQLPSQVSFQPIISMSGSVPIPQPYYNPSPIQSSGGFAPTQPAPTSLGAPLEVPVFSGETPKIIGDENVSVKVKSPVKAPTPIPVKEPPLSIITEITPSLRPPPPPVVSTPIIKPAPPKSIISQPSRGSDKQFLEPTPTPTPSVSSLFSDISKETGITSQKVADFLFKKKKQEPKAPPPSIASSSPPSSIASSSAMSVPTSIPTSTTKADYLFLDDRSIPEDKSISSMSGFNPPSEKSSIKKQPIIAEPKEVVVVKKPEKKEKNPYDIFSEAERSLPPNIIPSEDEASLAIIPRMVSEKKPPKKRAVVESDEEINIIPDVSAGRRMPPIPERKSNYQSKAELVSIAKARGIDLEKMNGKPKTRKDLYMDIYGR